MLQLDKFVTWCKSANSHKLLSDYVVPSGRRVSAQAEGKWTYSHTQSASQQSSAGMCNAQQLLGCLGLDFYPDEGHCQQATDLPMAQAYSEAFRGFIPLA